MAGETRRRGAALEEALLEAAWQELTDVGYARFTIEGVAARAGTSRPVIYRRWAQRADLAIAAIQHFSRYEEIAEVPDTGSFRDDLIAVLRDVSGRRSALITLFSVQMGEFFAETGSTPAELRAQFLAARQRPFGFDRVLERAIERGDVDPERLTPRVRAVPGDLLRHELLMTLRPASEQAIAEIVDEVFLPLVTKQR
ncbi:TetR/AcrR family transcriptional regulator [Paractinoplanes rhizophilus]|uniref:TetR/AcrR family transcriptional regulator n=1 Tax=Paractinoplanes rhizophilus TaxID=1416877 RepID=A0ABW2I222_9ACTN|nr:TetR/AcrR family transcriptional regulator [Actinoplanes sp.]